LLLLEQKGGASQPLPRPTKNGLQPLPSEIGLLATGAKMRVERKKRQISCRLRIEQRMVDPITNQSYFDILTKIASFLNCNLLLRKQVATGNVYYTLTASSSKSLKIIIDYFECYPLYSSKYLDYKD
jgi:hypothetical protein